MVRARTTQSARTLSRRACQHQRQRPTMWRLCSAARCCQQRGWQRQQRQHSPALQRPLAARLEWAAQQRLLRCRPRQPRAPAGRRPRWLHAALQRPRPVLRGWARSPLPLARWGPLAWAPAALASWPHVPEKCIATHTLSGLLDAGARLGHTGSLRCWANWRDRQEFGCAGDTPLTDASCKGTNEVSPPGALWSSGAAPLPPVVLPSWPSPHLQPSPARLAAHSTSKAFTVMACPPTCCRHDQNGTQMKVSHGKGAGWLCSEP
jgi:hypothetical protein